MVILTTKEGEAYHGTNGLPAIFDSADVAERTVMWPLLSEDCVLMELSDEEAFELREQAWRAWFAGRLPR